jgi:hypothetical protein
LEQQGRAIQLAPQILSATKRERRLAELPSYQAYLCLAWLVVAGVLEKHGRQGYTVNAAGDLDAVVESAWQQLPRR